MRFRTESFVVLCLAVGAVSCASSDGADSSDPISSDPISSEAVATDTVDGTEPDTTAPATEPDTTPPATEPPSTEPPATEPPATEPPSTEVDEVSSDPEPTDPEPTDAELTDTTVEIIDPTVGALSFDVRSAGDPSAAAEGRTVMLLHGFPETNRSWDHVAAALAAEGYYAVAMNQRGYSAGARPEGVENYGATHLVDDVYAVADAVGAETFHVVGHDWGSLVAWSVAGREAIEGAGRVTSLTALSVGHPLAFVGARSDPNTDQAERSGYFEVFQSPDAQDLFLADDAAFYRSLFDGAGYSDAELDAYLDVLGTPDAMSAALDWYRAIDTPAAGAGQMIGVPTLYIWSTGDAALGREQAELTRDFVTGPYTFVEVPDASHWVVHEEPDLVTGAILDHLASVAG